MPEKVECSFCENESTCTVLDNDDDIYLRLCDTCKEAFLAGQENFELELTDD